MSIQRVLYLDPMFPALKAVLEAHVPSGFELWCWDEYGADEREQRLKEADFLLVATHKVTRDLLQKAQRARMIQKTGIGVDNIDVSFASELGLPVCNTPGGNATGVAELTILLILALYRKLPQVNEATKAGRWLMWELRPFSYEMGGKVHGFIGFGNIGRAAARLSRAFGTTILYYDPFRLPQALEEELGVTYVSLEELLYQSDIVSLHLPLLPETRGLIGHRELSLMKKDAVLVNVSRGGIVDERALQEALESGKIAGAALDAWEKEPVPRDHPLLQLENVIASPHIGAGTRDTLDRVLHIAFQNMKKAISEGQPDYVLNGVTHTRTIERNGGNASCV